MKAKDRRTLDREDKGIEKQEREYRDYKELQEREKKEELKRRRIRYEREIL